MGGVQKKGADQGVDGVITLSDERNDLETVIVSVKSGHVGSPAVQQLKGAVESEKAAIGLFITLEEPTAPMRLEAEKAGLYTPNSGTRPIRSSRSSRAGRRAGDTPIAPDSGEHSGEPTPSSPTASVG